jgi:hypothetical protein
VDVDRPVRKEPHAGDPPERERGDDAEHGYEERRRADLHHLEHGGVEPHFEQEHDHPEARQDREGRIDFQRLEPVESDESQVPDQDPRHELSQDRRLMDAGRDPSPELGRAENHGEGEKERNDGVVRAGSVRPGHGDHTCRRDDQEWVDAASAEHRGSIPKGEGFW